MSTLLIRGFQSDLLVTRGLSDTRVFQLSINPGRIAPSATTTVSFIGTNTAWLTGPPTISATGAPTADGSWSLASLTVVDDTHATLAVTTGPTTGTVTWTDSTTSQTTTMAVAKAQNKGEIAALWVRRRHQTPSRRTLV